MPWDRIDVRGEPLLVHQDEAFSNHIKRTKDYYEAPILDYLRDNYPVQRTIVDVGANIGNHVMFFARYLQFEHIFAIEPVYANYTTLVNNLALIENTHVTAHNWGISDTRREALLKLNRGNMGAGEVVPLNSFADFDEHAYEKVQLYPLDWFNLQNISLLKIDVEWHEPEVLRGAKETIERCKPLILIEDTENTYQQLLPGYTLIKGWPEHSTYLYGVV